MRTGVPSSASVSGLGGDCSHSLWTTFHTCAAFLNLKVKICAHAQQVANQSLVHIYLALAYET